MKATRTDTSTAFVQALALHVVLFALLFFGFQWSRSSAIQAAQGDPIEADLANVNDLSVSMQRALQRAPAKQKAPPVPKPEPLPEPVPDEAHAAQAKALPPPVPEPAPVEQDRVQRNADSSQVAKVPREQEEKRKQPDQAELDAKKQSEMERQRQRQIEDIRRQREQATRERTQAEMRAQQLADARGTRPLSTPPPTGAQGIDAGLTAKYAAALQQAIRQQWTRPDSVQLGQLCRITIHQIPGGQVISVDISPSCPYDSLGRHSVEAAVLKASPLPYAGYEAVFNRILDLNFVAQDR